MTRQLVTQATASSADLRIADRQLDVLETLELRWFATGRIPASAIRWFEGAAPHVEVEERLDSYLLTGRPDLGAKRRHYGPLQVKERRRMGGWMSVGGRLVGCVEEWHKTNQTRSPVAGDRWVDVDKTVLTYWYSQAGAHACAAACDIELAAVRAEGLEAWTLAFEASGPPSDRMGTLRSAIEQFLSETDVPAGVAEALELEAGYPAWLVSVTGP